MNKKMKATSLQNFFGRIGRTVHSLLDHTGRMSRLLGDVFRWTWLSFFQKKVLRRESFFGQVVAMGVDSVPIICLVGASVGMVLALQAAYQLKQFGAVMYTGSLVSVSMARELGPLIAAIVVAGRVGARIAAELGTMRAQEEVDALTTMAIDPVRYLVLPRCLSLFLVLPCLTLIADSIGMAGGFLIGTTSLGIEPYLYLEKNFDALVLKDLYTGLLKSAVFAWIVGIVSCYQGLAVEGGAEEVGRATTQAVVNSIVLIILADCFFTAIFYYAFP